MPENSVKLYGPLPSEAEMVSAYASSDVAAGSTEGEIVIAGQLTKCVYSRVAEQLLASVARMVNV
jgi:hypothetical protein